MASSASLASSTGESCFAADRPIEILKGLMPPLAADVAGSVAESTAAASASPTRRKCRR